MIFLLVAPPAILATELTDTEVQKVLPTDNVEDLPAQAKNGALTISDGTTTSFLSNAIYVVPVLIAIILVDFAIFGAFASRSDELNPVSNFFYHVKRGLSIVRDRSSASIYNRPHNYNRYTRLCINNQDTC